MAEKARRGEFFNLLPPGYVLERSGAVVKSPEPTCGAGARENVLQNPFYAGAYDEKIRKNAHSDAFSHQATSAYIAFSKLL